jgi:hypothetical protein
VHRPSALPGAAPTALHSGGGIVDETGIMTDGAGVPTGTPLSDPPLVSAISEDPLLRNVKLIAEAWDCDGLYQVRGVLHLEPSQQHRYSQHTSTQSAPVLEHLYFWRGLL